MRIGEFRNLMSDLQFDRPTWSDQVEKMLVRLLWIVLKPSSESS